MKKEYWDVEDQQVIEKTGNKITEQITILDKFKAAEKKSNDVVASLQKDVDVPSSWGKNF